MSDKALNASENAMSIDDLLQRIVALEKREKLVREAFKQLDLDGQHGRSAHNAYRAAALIEFGPLPDDPELADIETQRRVNLSAELGVDID